MCAEDVQPDPTKVSVIRDWPALNILHGVQQFVGLRDCCKHYIQGYGPLVAPLRKLAQKAVSLQFASAASEAFPYKFSPLTSLTSLRSQAGLQLVTCLEPCKGCYT